MHVKFEVHMHDKIVSHVIKCIEKSSLMKKIFTCITKFHVHVKKVHMHVKC